MFVLYIQNLLLLLVKHYLKNKQSYIYNYYNYLILYVKNILTIIIQFYKKKYYKTVKCNNYSK